MDNYKFNTIPEAIEDIKNGKMIIVVDDESRENEGDIIMAAEKVTGEAMNFIATYAKGLICLPTSREIAEKLKIEEMCKINTDNHCTAFTETIDHIDTTTGISAFERAYTVNKFVCDDAKPEDFRRPGHIFPLIAKDRGVLERNGHTEATVDLARLAGLKPAGICCEIMSADGHMARTPELMELSKKWGLKIITVESLIKYIQQNHCCIERAVEAKLPTRYGNFNINGYYDRNNGQHHVALYMGDIADKKPVLVRVHSECLTGDALGSVKCDCGQQYDAAMKAIAREGRGILVYMRQEGRGIGLINKLKAYALQDKGMDTVEANLALGFPEDMRNYDIAAQILNDMGVNEIRLMTNNPDKITKLENSGIKVVERVNIQVDHYKEADFYLHTKKAKMGHILNFREDK